MYNSELNRIKYITNNKIINIFINDIMDIMISYITKEGETKEDTIKELIMNKYKEETNQVGIDNQEIIDGILLDILKEEERLDGIDYIDILEEEAINSIFKIEEEEETNE